MLKKDFSKLLKPIFFSSHSNKRKGINKCRAKSGVLKSDEIYMKSCSLLSFTAEVSFFFPFAET